MPVSISTPVVRQAGAKALPADDRQAIADLLATLDKTSTDAVNVVLDVPADIAASDDDLSTFKRNVSFDALQAAKRVKAPSGYRAATRGKYDAEAGQYTVSVFWAPKNK